MCNYWTCNYTIRKESGLRVVYVDCISCEFSSSFLDENCRKGILSILLKETRIDRIILNHSLAKIIDGDSLIHLKKLSNFIENLQSIKIVEREDCGECFKSKEKEIEEIKEKAFLSPIKAFHMLRKLWKEERKPIVVEREACALCRRELLSCIKRIIKEFDDFGKEDDSFYVRKIRPYVRPIFFDTFVQYIPPPDAVFIRSYEVKRGKGYPMKVSLYDLKTRPEKLYFMLPPEYNLHIEELKILQKAKDKLAKHRPRDASFMDPETAREYFYHFGKEKIKEIAEENSYHLSSEKLDMLADIFAKYTAGFGILEDLLADINIQDIYINAPVSCNPLHIILDGEEYVTNIYFSETDVEALSSRLRSLSGRGFSEALPVMDAGLLEYGSRITAISPPLTPKGIAFAIRRHSQTPWTLPKFISRKMLSPLAAGLLSFLVDGQATILIAGSRGAGKTSLLSALILEIPQRYRILTIEDTPELPIEKLQKLGYKIQSLITKSAVAEEGIDEKTAIKTALRLGESVLILGEVRGEETKVLFEAMRVGAAGNLVMGTIHGASTRDVFDRIVYDIGIPPTSFKATDIVVIAAPIRIAGGMEKKRRVIQISEVGKKWMEDEVDKVFSDIMKYNASKDELEATDIFYMGQSEIIGKIAMDWGISIEEAIENIKMRARMKEKMVEYGKTNKKLLEAKAVRDANNAYWIIVEGMKEKGELKWKEVEEKWTKWLCEYAGIK